jgi:amino acid permease
MQRLGWPASTWSSIGGAEFVFSFVVGILSMIVGILIAKGLGLPRSPSLPLPGLVVILAMQSSVRPRPDKLRDNRFWIRRTLLYMTVIIASLILTLWLYTVIDRSAAPFLYSVGLTTIPALIVIAIPRAITERLPDEPRFHISSVIAAMILSLLANLVELGVQALGL